MSTKRPKDRSGLCAFTFADGRQCRTPRRSGHLHLCAFHAQREAQSQAAKQAGEDISSFFFGNYLSACDLSAALGRVFSAVAQGHLKPKAATALAYLGQTLNQSVQLAQDEYANVFGDDVWRRRVAACLVLPPPAPAPKPRSQPPLNAATKTPFCLPRSSAVGNSTDASGTATNNATGSAADTTTGSAADTTTGAPTSTTTRHALSIPPATINLPRVAPNSPRPRASARWSVLRSAIFSGNLA